MRSIHMLFLYLCTMHAVYEQFCGQNLASAWVLCPIMLTASQNRQRTDFHNWELPRMMEFLDSS